MRQRSYSVDCLRFLPINVGDYFTSTGVHYRRVVLRYISLGCLLNRPEAAKDMSMTMPEVVATGA